MRKTHLLIDSLLVGAAVYEAIVIYKMRKTCGTLKIDHTGEKELYRFEIGDFDGLSKKKYIRLRVDNNADFSQK